MGDQEQSRAGDAYDMFRKVGTANGLTKTGQTIGNMAGGMGARDAIGASRGFLGTAGKVFSPLSLVHGVMGAGQGINEMMNAENGSEMATGGLRTLGGVAGATSGAIGTMGLLGAGATALGAAGTGAALTGAAAAAAPVAAVAAPLAAAIGLGFRGESFMQEHFGGGVGDFISGGGDIGRDVAGFFGADEDSWVTDAAGYAGNALGAVAGGVTAVGAGVAGVAEDAWSLITSW